MNSAHPFAGWFQQEMARADTVKGDVGVVFVANIIGRTTPLDDYESDSIVTEFLSNSELDEFIEGFEKAGIYCEVVFDEEGFLQWLASRSRFGRRQPLIYNLAQNGIGPARLSLVPGLCRLHHLPLIDSDGHVVALTQHKFHCACVLKQCGLPAVSSWWFTDRGWIPSRPPDGSKVIAKPIYDSASIGVHEDSVFMVADNCEADLRSKVLQFKQPFIVQEFVAGFEVEVPVFGGSEPRVGMAVGLSLNGQRDLRDSILVYDDIYQDSYEFFDFAKEDSTLADAMMGYAREAYAALGFKGAARIDFRIGADRIPKIIEVACKPHLTRHSSFMFVVEQNGFSHPDFLKYLVGESVGRLRTYSVS